MMDNHNWDKIGQFIILKKLDTGGMATVYLCYDAYLEREVAIKVINPEFQDKEFFRRRFKQEARTLADLDHPNIVKVFLFGEQDGIPYLVMPYLKGGSLAERKKPIPYDEAARLLLPIADALNYAHGKNVIHRDVKPANILFEGDKPMLADFGIAKLLGQRRFTHVTIEGGFAGTYAYMAPEQYENKVESASDQYALGVVYYELVTGHLPFKSQSREELDIEELPDPRNYVPELPYCVVQFLSRVLAKEPERRYKNMIEFSSGLDVLGHGSIAFEPSANGPSVEPEIEELDEGEPEKQKKIEPPGPASTPGQRRRPLAIAAGLMFLLVAVTLIFMASRLFPLVSESRTTEVAVPEAASTPADAARAQVVPSAPAPVDLPASGLTPPTETAGGEPAKPARALASWNTGSRRQVVFSPDGQYLAASDGTGVDIYDFASGSLVNRMSQAGVNGVSFSPDSTMLAAGLPENSARIWNVRDGSPVKQLVGHTGPVEDVTFSPDGITLASVSQDHTLRVWVYRSFIYSEWPTGELEVSRVRYSHSGERLALMCQSGKVLLWDVEAGKQAGVLSAKNQSRAAITSVSFSPDDRLVLTSAGDGYLRLWQVNPPAPLADIDASPGLTGAEFSPNGKLIASSALDGTIRLWDAESGKLLVTLNAHTGAVNSIAFSPDGRVLASSSEDGTIRFWSVAQ